MKTIIFIFLLIPFSFIGQEKKNVFNLLLTAGVSPSQVHGDAYSGFHKLGAMGGIGVESVFSESTSMNLSFLFIQKGAQKNQNLTKNDLTYYYLNLNYLEVPLLVTYTQKKFLFDIGVSAAYLINYYEASEAGNLTGLYPFQKFDYSVKIGLGYNITPKWFVNFRSSNSFITTRPNRIKQAIYYNNIIARTFNKGYYNNILEFTLGYRIKTNNKKVGPKT
ncbi:MAG: PorT family protein [Bacteroidetes bacterium]|nr:PorT family protein [Bacteroidota bacterium]